MPIHPPYLKQGDLIEIVSTARKISVDEVKPAKAILEKWGFKVRYSSLLFEEENQFAGSDLQRLNSFQSAIDNDDVKAVLCARGGYGTVRIIDDINWLKFLNKPKWVIGFSDVTVLHFHLNKMGVESIHAIMPILFNQKGNELALDSLKNTLLGNRISYVFPAHKYNISGEVTSEIVGGNLSIINQIIGTPSFPDLKGKVLFIEDLDEYLYHIDRMMYQLKRAGVFDDISGLIVGYMSDMNDNNIPFGKNALEIISEHVLEYSFPVAFNAPIGHQADNRAVLCGSKINLKVDSKESTIKFLAN